MNNGWFSTSGLKKIYLEIDDVIVGDVIANVFEKMTYWWLEL